MKDEVFLCGYRRGKRLPLTLDDLTKAEHKTVKNFSEYLRGRGERCPQCLHKAVKHELRCGARGCDCPLDNRGVHAVRAQVQAPGWRDDG